MNFKEKVVVVTGASSGIGLALVRDFSKRGARVVLVARSLERLNDIAKSLPNESLVVQCDVSVEDECREMVHQTILTFGRIDILINNAGLSMRALFDDVSLDVLHRLMDVNFWGTVNCTKYVLPYIQQSRGSIVGVSSVAGIHGLPARTGYSASKYAMVGFLETIRIENLYKGVHVMIASPGFTASNVRFAALTADGTTQGESPRNEKGMMSAERVAEIIIKGISRRKRLLLMEFQGRATHFVKKIAPSWLDKMFYNHMASEVDSPLKKVKSHEN